MLQRFIAVAIIVTVAGCALVASIAQEPKIVVEQDPVRGWAFNNVAAKAEDELPPLMPTPPKQMRVLGVCEINDLNAPPVPEEDDT
jgi:hypothetical protein